MSLPPPTDLTELLRAWSAGDAQAIDRLMPLVYAELHAIAAAYLRRERSDHTLQATAVIHEAYLRMVEKTHPGWQGRVHFFAVAATLMRRVLVDHARTRKTAKRGGGLLRVPLHEGDANDAAVEVGILDLDLALSELATFDERKARVVELVYFGGLTADEAAGVLGVSTPTVRLDTRLARAWLHRRLDLRGANA